VWKKSNLRFELKMSDKWTGKTAVVTGASAGIGAAIFKELVRSGINTIGLARRSEKVDEIINELGATQGKAFAHKCDVSDPKSVTETFKWIEEKFGVVHILYQQRWDLQNRQCSRRDRRVLGSGE
jgi:NADP-dependent 3-hydroxy acid dehydrogenase YdfG